MLDTLDDLIDLAKDLPDEKTRGISRLQLSQLETVVQDKFKDIDKGRVKPFYGENYDN
tara:strand:+ start:3957 stop:4130 length:174 start_codon:yes stop_codon:yes gene_type:complete